jgi:trigger factor
MEIITEDIGEQRKAIKIKVKPEDYKAKVLSGLKAKQQKVEMPGFRKGHIPLDLIIKHYGDYILYEELHKIVPESMEKFFKENNLDLISHAIPMKDNYLFKEDWNLDTVFEFDYELGLAPDIDLEQPLNDVIYRYVLDGTETMIDEEVEKMRKRYGNYIHPETTQKNDFVFGEFIELDENLNKKESGIDTKGVFVLDLISNESDRNKFIGLKKDDEVIFDIVKVVNNDAEISHLLNVKRDDIKNLSSNFRFIVKEITRIELPELHQEQFDKWYGEGKINGLEDYRRNIKMSILENYVTHSNNQLSWDIKEYLLKKLDPHIPFEYIKNMITYNNSMEENKEEIWSPEKIEEVSKRITNNYKWSFIEVAIVRKFNIQATNEEIGKLAYYQVIEKMNDDKVDMTEENYNQYVADLQKDKETLEYLEDAIINNKVFHNLSEFLNIDVMPLPFDIFSSKMTYKKTR